MSSLSPRDNLAVVGLLSLPFLGWAAAWGVVLIGLRSPAIEPALARAANLARGLSATSALASFLMVSAFYRGSFGAVPALLLVGAVQIVGLVVG